MHTPSLGMYNCNEQGHTISLLPLSGCLDKYYVSKRIASFANLFHRSYAADGCFGH